MLNEEIDLFEALALPESAEEVKRFLTDLCTPSEIRDLKERWQVCQLLSRKTLSYREIREKSGASLTTIGRVSRFLNDEPYGGYRDLLEKIQKSEKKK